MCVRWEVKALWAVVHARVLVRGTHHMHKQPKLLNIAA